MTFDTFLNSRSGVTLDDDHIAKWLDRACNVNMLGHTELNATKLPE